MRSPYWCVPISGTLRPAFDVNSHCEKSVGSISNYLSVTCHRVFGLERPMLNGNSTHSAAKRRIAANSRLRHSCTPPSLLYSLFFTMNDLRYAFRRLLASPGFTIVVILTLALGIGANTAVFSIVNATFLRPLPYADPEKLMLLSESGSQFGELGVSYPDFLDWHAQQDVFSGLALYHPDSAKLKTAASTELLSTCLVSGDFFPVLGLRAAQGRDLTSADDRVGAAPVAWVAEVFRRRSGARRTHDPPRRADGHGGRHPARGLPFSPKRRSLPAARALRQGPFHDNARQPQ